MPRVTPETKARIVKAALATDRSPEALDRVAKAGDLRSRRTVERWLLEARAAEVDPPPPAGTSAAAAADPSAPPPVRTPGAPELVLEIMRFGMSFTMKGAALVAGVDLTHPALRSVAALTPDEETLITKMAPALLPALDTLLKWIENHGVAVFCVLFAGLVGPRVLLLGKVAKKIKQLEAVAAELQKKVAERDRTPPPAAAPTS